MRNNLERINPDAAEQDEITGHQALELHLQRYRFAGKYLGNGVVADIACGAGYGSYLLAEEFGQHIKQIFAVDNDADSIEFASLRYAHNKIRFIESDALSFQSPEKLNTVVSLETIEHLEKPAVFVQHIVLQLVTGGRFIASVPITPSMDANPYHLHDFSIKRFKKMFTDCGMKEIDSMIQEQPYNLFSIMQRKEERSKELRKNIAGFYLKHPNKFFLRLRSLIQDGLMNKYMVTAFQKL